MMHFSQLPFFHFPSMKETKSETSSPKYAPTMESVERASACKARSQLPKQPSDANPFRPANQLSPLPRHRPNTTHPYALDMTPQARMMLSV